MKLQYLIDPLSELTTDYISKAIMSFSTRWQPELNRMLNYANGRQKICRKRPTDVGKPCNIIVANYCDDIIANYNGYLTGIPIKYTNDEFEDVINVLNYNDTTTEDSEYLRQALIYGRAFEICYIDEEGKQRFKLFDTRECIPVYSNSLNGELLYVIRFYRDEQLQNSQEGYWVEVYGPNLIRKYKSTPGFTSMSLAEEIPHFYNQCPVTVFSLNEDETSIFNQIISLQDAYNELLSSGVDDFSSFADAYLVLKGVIADKEELIKMKENRVLMVDTDASAEYLTKEINNSQLEYLMNTINDQIHKISACPDFNDEKFMAQSGEALKYKLVQFENKSANIENNMRKALQRRVELICEILSLTDDEQKWRDVKINFTRNLPSNLSPTTVDELIAYKTIVSDKTLLSLVPFVKDPDEELERLLSQKETNLDLYGFTNFNRVDSEGNEEDTE